ncbi:MAG: hypothetical protein ACXW2E_01280 [Nitrososphaeraceae archaeon]
MIEEHKWYKGHIYRIFYGSGRSGCITEVHINGTKRIVKSERGAKLFITNHIKQNNHL